MVLAPCPLENAPDAGFTSIFILPLNETPLIVLSVVNIAALALVPLVF